MADGPGGTEVGRVYIRVLPNTAEFAAKLKAAIKSMSDNVKVDVDLDDTKARARLKAMQGTTVTVVADADTAKAQAQLDR
ncbi:hypothetical protein ACFC1L_40090, partial [Streptomyces sp. NPDC056210]|uniref:hypothetical protein n=1 Tax=Streptomyces sp. NPDC056210 TaxID=3345746 RepID=UPI0035DA7CF6